MSASRAYYFLMTGADSVSLALFRDLRGAELTQELESGPLVGEKAANSFCLPAVH